MRLPKLAGLWQNADFIKLWTGQTVSIFGTLMGALQFTAVLVLHATPFQMGVLAALRVAPGLIVGLVAGVWVDRLRRRPILVAADLGRAALMGSIPAAFFIGQLRIQHLYFVAFASGVLTIFFDVAYRSYLPSLVLKKDLVEANSKLSASESVVEVIAFSVGGWISQLLSAIALAAIDALSFLVSGISLALVHRSEPSSEFASKASDLRREVAEGLSLVWSNAILRPIAGSTLALGFSTGVVGALILVFGIRELGFQPGALGTIFAVGGVSAIFGAVYAGRLTHRFGVGPTMVGGLLIFVLSIFFIPAASGPLFVAGAFLVAQQLGDGPMTVHEINQMSLRQAITPGRMLGRVNASIRVIELSAMLIGSLVAGVLGEVIGMRLTLVVGACVGLLGVLWLAVSPVLKIKAISSSMDESSSSPEAG
ncbi:MAG: MFS transporter [Chloroflexi bacterium]|nr:MFS transporter [Chloroflexota bacterium]